MNKRIEVHPQIMTGKPVIKGTRIPIAVILNLLANGYTTEKIIETYPPLTPEDIKAALKYSENIVKREKVFVPKRVSHVQITA